MSNRHLWDVRVLSGKCFLTSFFCLTPQIENYIKDNMKTEIVQLQQSAVHNHTAAMLEMGTSLLSQTAEQTRKLTDVETQVCSCQDPFHAPLSQQPMYPFNTAQMQPRKTLVPH